MTVLIVEDDAGVRKLFSYMFRGTGHDAVYAEDLAAAAKRLAELSECALLITDYKLPDGLSLDFVRALRTKFPAAGVLVATGSLGVDSELRSLDGLELSGILRKPFDPDEALELIQLVLRAHNS